MIREFFARGWEAIIPFGIKDAVVVLSGVVFR